VEALPKSMFRYCLGLSRIQLNDQIKSVGDRCFEGCSSLKKVEFLNKLDSIGYLAFSECKQLKEIVLRGVKEIGTDMQLRELKAKVLCPLSGWGDRGTKGDMLDDFLDMLDSGYPIPEDIVSENRKYIKKNRKKLFEQAIDNEKLLRYMFAEKLILLTDIDSLLSITEDRMDLRMEIMNYQNTEFSDKDRTKLQESKMKLDDLSLDDLD
jgi:hypothetical protein